jgi:hypothetical protein
MTMSISTYKKVCKTIDSCNTYKDIEVAYKMVEQFKALHVLSTENTIITRLRSRIQAREKDIKNIYKRISITPHPILILI